MKIELMPSHPTILSALASQRVVTPGASEERSRGCARGLQTATAWQRTAPWLALAMLSLAGFSGCADEATPPVPHHDDSTSSSNDDEYVGRADVDRRRRQESRRRARPNHLHPQ